MKRILINASQPEELRVAMVDGQHLFNLDIEAPSHEKKKANIYKGRITRIEPSLEAAFVDYGAERHGFLPLKEVSPHLFRKTPEEGKRVEIKEVLSEGQEIVVQVNKEERGNKGAALTTFISLAGRYLVLMPNNPRAGGISRRIEGEERNELREVISQLEIPEGIGVIIRTAGVGKSTEEISWDLGYLLQLWEAIDKASRERPAPFLIYQESDVIIRAIRDYLSPDIGEIIIDNAELHAKARDFMQLVMPHNLHKLKFYDDATPLFTRFQIETQIEAAFQHEVRLPSGGSLVIDHTEALVAIDINSSRATKGGDIEETALNTNLEAADEIARQLRLRDLGGLIVIDFIDMTPSRNQREVENRLKAALASDRARIQVGRISRFGLLELSRQRLRPSLGESAHRVCPRCSGQGVIRNVESLSLSILRLIAEHANKEGTARIVAQLPVSVATYLLNEKRLDISEIEQRKNVRIYLIANTTMESPNYEVTRLHRNELPREERASYDMVDRKPTEDLEDMLLHSKHPPEKPAVSGIKPATPMPTRAATGKTRGEGFIKQLWTSLFGGGDKPRPDDAETKTTNERASRKATARQEGTGPARSERRGAAATDRKRTGNGGGNRRGPGRRSGGRRGNGGRAANERPESDTALPASSSEPTSPSTAADESGTTSAPAPSGGGGGRRRGRGRRSRGGRQGGRRNGDARGGASQASGAGETTGGGPASPTPEASSPTGGASQRPRNDGTAIASPDRGTPPASSTSAGETGTRPSPTMTAPALRPPVDAVVTGGRTETSGQEAATGRSPAENGERRTTAAAGAGGSEREREGS